MNPPSHEGTDAAIAALQDATPLDEHGIMVAASRQAIDTLIAAYRSQPHIEEAAGPSHVQPPDAVDEEGHADADAEEPTSVWLLRERRTGRVFDVSLEEGDAREHATYEGGTVSEVQLPTATDAAILEAARTWEGFQPMLTPCIALAHDRALATTIRTAGRVRGAPTSHGPPEHLTLIP